MQLDRLVDARHTAVLTQECQKGVLGPQSQRPVLYEHGHATGKLDNMGRVVAAARAAGCVIVHAIAAHRDDLRGSNTNARMFTSVARDGLLQTLGSDRVEVIDEIGTAPDDLFSVRLHGGSPIAGTDVDALLRNCKINTVVIVGASTNLGVTSGVFDAVNLGYEVVVPRDAVIGLPVEYSDMMIEYSLKLVATITTTEALVDAWSRRA